MFDARVPIWAASVTFQQVPPPSHLCLPTFTHTYESQETISEQFHHSHVNKTTSQPGISKQEAKHKAVPMDN